MKLKLLSKNEKEFERKKNSCLRMRLVLGESKHGQVPKSAIGHTCSRQQWCILIKNRSSQYNGDFFVGSCSLIVLTMFFVSINF